MSAFGLYVHIPFCAQVCPYCAFVTVRGRANWHGRYVGAVCRELESARHLRSRGPLDSVFLGGGTPSLLEPALVHRLLRASGEYLGISPGAEVTLEANPGGADAEKFGRLREAGCNRLSLGVQSFVARDLEVLGRAHGVAEAERAFALARAAGFDNLSLDLIFGVPGAPFSHWRRSLERAVELEPEHISTYGLTIEENTLFGVRRRQGRLELVGEDEEAQMYEWTMGYLAAAGYEHYEVSNFARPGRYSRHNWGYWTGAEYLGVGLSAHSFVDGRRRWNTRDLARYIEALEAGRSPVEGGEEIDAPTARRERLWMGLRTGAGAPLAAGERRRLEADHRFRAFVQEGYLRWGDDALCLTPRGFLLADALGVELVGILE